jgi:hypothetical protein
MPTTPATLVQPARPGVLTSRSVRTTPAGSMRLSERYSAGHTVAQSSFPWGLGALAAVLALIYVQRGQP